jgi:hypothetical protein
MGTGDIFIVPQNTIVSVPHADGSPPVLPVSSSQPLAPALDAGTISSFVGGKEGFNNDLDQKKPLKELSDDYMMDLLNLGLDEEVIKSHKEYATAKFKVANNDKNQSVRDDQQDVVPFQGLFNRPQYNKVKVDWETARSVPTEVGNLDILSKHKELRWF